MKSNKLSPLSAELNRLTLIRLQKVMSKHGVSRAQVADLLGYSRVLVTRWFKGERRCAEGNPDRLRMILEIRARSSVKEELVMKRRGHTKRRKLTPSYPTKV